MSSQRKIESARANGARSRGPVTAEGKQRSARNAVRHGLLAKTVVLADEDPEAFRALVDSFVSRLVPEDEIELALIEQMAAAFWRQTRSSAIENKIIDNAAATAASSGPVERLAHAFTTLATGPELTLMHRYETRQNRMFQRALANLLLLRKENLRNEPNPEIEHSPDLPQDLGPDPEPQPQPEPERKPEPIRLAPNDFPDLLGDFVKRS
jgi:hypothetical protein